MEKSALKVWGLSLGQWPSGPESTLHYLGFKFWSKTFPVHFKHTTNCDFAKISKTETNHPTGIFSHISICGLAQKRLISTEWITYKSNYFIQEYHKNTTKFFYFFFSFKPLLQVPHLLLAALCKSTSLTCGKECFTRAGKGKKNTKKVEAGYVKEPRYGKCVWTIDYSNVMSLSVDCVHWVCNFKTFVLAQFHILKTHVMVRFQHLWYVIY